MYDLLINPPLAVIFVFTADKVYLQFINILHLAVIFVLLHQQQLIYSLFGRHIYFSLFMPITFEGMHRCIYIYIYIYKVFKVITLW